MSSPDTIFAELKDVRYSTKISTTLEVFGADDFVKGKLASKASFIIRSDKDEYAVSQWVSPKRTRTYPFARVYSTLDKKNRITIIPFCKDEGKDGDRDFIQWDTVALMSLLNVFVIIGYYTTAEKTERPDQNKKHKITNQKFNYNYIYKKLNELQNYHSSVLHWNLQQMEQLSDVARLTLHAYQKISKTTGVQMHGDAGIENRIATAKEGSSRFRDLSRQLAEDAQHRESLTQNPKEKTIGQKVTVTLKNLLGGIYFLTADECFVVNGRVVIIEKKHSKSKSVPSIYDIKDAFIKMALFSNIDKLQFNGADMPHYAAVGLTSENVRGVLHSEMTKTELDIFFAENNFSKKNCSFMLTAIDEARTNNFGLFLMNSDDVADKQIAVLQKLIH